MVRELEPPIPTYVTGGVSERPVTAVVTVSCGSTEVEVTTKEGESPEVNDTEYRVQGMYLSGTH